MGLPGKALRFQASRRQQPASSRRLYSGQDAPHACASGSDIDIAGLVLSFFQRAEGRFITA